MSHCLIWLNECGLVLAMIGGLILFFWRLPSPPPMSWGPTDPPPDSRTAADVVLASERQRLFLLLMARFGLGLIILGFALQVVANFPYVQLSPSQ